MKQFDVEHAGEHLDETSDPSHPQSRSVTGGNKLSNFHESLHHDLDEDRMNISKKARNHVAMTSATHRGRINAQQRDSPERGSRQPDSIIETREDLEEQLWNAAQAARDAIEKMKRISNRPELKISNPNASRKRKTGISETASNSQTHVDGDDTENALVSSGEQQASPYRHWIVNIRRRGRYRDSVPADKKRKVKKKGMFVNYYQHRGRKANFLNH